jgi:ABC-type transport system involved in multi-copper enzyme maturation permease subunit
MTALAPSLPLPRLVRAEVLKLRKRRGLVAITALLTLVPAIGTYGVLAILHWANPAHHGPAGGVTNLGHGLWVLAILGSVAATIVGATAGSGDLSAGVFRELVVTGRSRRALFRARIPGGLAFLLAFVAVAYALAAVATVVFAGSLTAPSTGLLASSGAWLLLSCAFWFALALGVASLVGSRSMTIGGMLAFRLAVSPLLLSIGPLGAVREAVPQAGLERLAPHAVREFTQQATRIPMSVSVAELVLLAWAVAALAFGAWRTVTRDA